MKIFKWAQVWRGFIQLYLIINIAAAQANGKINSASPKCPEGYWGIYCHLEDKCFYNGRRKDYLGHINKTKNNIDCKNWLNTGGTRGLRPEDFPDGNRNHSFCRSVPEDGSHDIPWCYEATTEGKFILCAIGNCKCPGNYDGNDCNDIKVYYWKEGLNGKQYADLKERGNTVETKRRCKEAGGIPRNPKSREETDFLNKYFSVQTIVCERKSLPPSEIENTYKFVQGSKTLTEAGDHCESLGGFIAEPRSPEEFNYITGLAQKYKKVKEFWIGGKNNSVGNWTWFSTGDVINYPPWINGQPNGTGDCLRIWRSINFNLDDVSCKVNRRSDATICQYGETLTKGTQWSVRVLTSDKARAGTQDKVLLKIIGTKGQTNDLHLYKRNSKNKKDTYNFRSVNIGEHRFIKVWITGNDAWHPEKIEIKEEGDVWIVYHINRWLGQGQPKEVTVNAPEHPLITCSKVDQEIKMFVPFVIFTSAWLVVVLLTLQASINIIRRRLARQARKKGISAKIKRLKTGAGNIVRNAFGSKKRDPPSRNNRKPQKKRGFFGRMKKKGRRDSDDSYKPRRGPASGSRYSSKRKTNSRYSTKSQSSKRSNFSNRRPSPESSSDSSDDSGSSSSGSS